MVDEKDVLAEAYRRFPDEVEPIPEHQAWRITVDRGGLRYAFVAGAMFAESSTHTNGDST